MTSPAANARRILEQAGYSAWTAEVLDEVERIITTNEVGLLIVCQTLADGPQSVHR